MKKLLVFCCLLSYSLCLHAQTWDEWFNQKNTQVKYLVQQIAALQMYETYLHKGYSIVRDGTKLIGDVKQGDFDLHSGHFVSLSSINPSISRGKQVADAIHYGYAIEKNIKGIRSLRNDASFTASERQYIAGVVAQLEKDCAGQLDALSDITTAGKLPMSDDERLQRIDQIKEELREQYRFCLHFQSELQVLLAQKTKETEDIQTIRKLNALQP